MPSLQRRRLADYRAATRNEIAIDEHMRRVAGLPAPLQLDLPRVQRWAPAAQRHPRALPWAVGLLKALWTGLLAPALFGLQLLQLLLNKARTPASGTPLPSPGQAVGVAFSSRAVELIEAPGFPLPVAQWLVFPWLDVSEALRGRAQQSCLDLLSYRDLFGAWADAVAAARSARRSPQLSAWRLQTYTAFRWMVARRAVDRVAAQFLCAEHYDRWAILLDRSLRQRRAPRSGWTLVQHGAVASLADEAASTRNPGRELPTRLAMVARLVAFNEASLHFFKAHVLAQRSQALRQGDLVHAPRVPLTPVPGNAEQCRLLIVGHPFAEAFHEHAYRHLRKQDPRLICLYKPHPHAEMSAAMRLVGWTLVDEPGRFPEVDLLLSYPSTLVDEYGTLGVPAVVHPISLSPQAAAPVLDELDMAVARAQRTRSPAGATMRAANSTTPT